MKNYKLVFAIIVIISILIFYFSPTLESFRGRRGGYIVNRRGMHGRGGWPGHYLDHFRRRNNGYYRGGGGGYYGGGDSYYRSGPFWNSMFLVPAWENYWGISPCNCKRGCTPEGCTYPGTGIDDCVWSTDCNCCGF